MAGGYLGKISAVIAANTGDYVRGLNEGAKATRDFAKTVQSTLNRSATEAARAFEGIYTPLQQFERAIRQAGQLRLNFKGFDGAVRTINDLQKRLNDVLTSSEIDLIVKTSGLKDIEAVKNAINSLSRDEINLSAVAGGRAGLLRERERLRASNLSSTSIAGVDATVEQIDSLIAKLNVLDDRKIDLIIDIVNQRGLDEAITKARQLQDVATQIAAPLGAASAEFQKLSQAAQGQFAPALGKAQSAVERFKADIAELGPQGRRVFRDLRADVDIVAAAIGRLSELRSLTGGLLTGRELNLVSPEIVDTLNRLQTAQRQLAAAPAGVRGSPLGREVVADAQVLQEQLNRVLARIERIRTEGGDITFSQRGLDVILQRLRQAADETERLSSLGGGLGFVSSQGDPSGTFGPPRPFTRLPPGYFTQRFSARPGDPDGTFGPPVPPDIERRRQIAREQARLASGFLSINQQESDLLSNQGRATPLTGDRNPRTRVLDGLRGEISTTRRLIGDLAGPLRDQLGPEVDRINNEFRQLARDGIGVSADAARRLNGEVNAINASLQRRRGLGREFSEQFGGRGAAGLGLGVDQNSLRAIGGQIEFVQQRLGRLTAEVRGPTLQSLERFRATASRLFDAGTIDTESGRRELELLRQDLARTLSAAGGGSRGSILRGLTRAGDVGRGGFDRFSLGIQQAAFAVEDFFSVTGGLDQRVRAAGNNISQLGFILGGTAGLIAGIAGAIGSQLVVALIKWYNNGRTTEDQMKALNDVLSRQKSLVEDLAQAFASIGDSLGRKVFSGAAQDAEEFRKSLDSVRKKQDELREQRAFSLDERVLRARADVNVAERNLAKATTRDEAAAAQLELRDARERLRREERRVRDRPAPDPADVNDRVRDIFTEARKRATIEAASAAFDPETGAAAAAVERALGDERTANVLQRVGAAGNAADVVSVLRDEQRQAVDRGDDRLAAQLEELINSLEEPAARAIDELARRILDGSRDVSQSLSNARAAVEAALAAGVPGATGFSSQVNEAGRVLQAAITQLEEAYQIEDSGARQAAVQAARESVVAARAQASAIDEQRKAIESSTDSINRFSEALRSITQIAESNLNAAESRRDRAREEFLARPTDRSAAALRRAEDDVRRQEELRNTARREAALAEERARQDPQTQADERRIREIDQLLNATGVLAPGQREQLIAEREDLRARADRRARAAVENDPLLRDARDASIREEQRQQMAADGSNLRLSDGQRARLELDNQIAAVRESIGRDIAAAGGDGAAIERLLREQQSVEQRLRDDAMRQAAPGIFSLADAVQNAVLQGPSRAALAPTDVSTVEGSRELSRLLRGDDAARNQDLVQLQREANRLLELIANNGGAGVAN